MAEFSEDTFASVFVSDVPVNPASYLVFNGVMPDINISVGGVCDVLQSLDCNSAVGPDQVHSLSSESPCSSLAH